MCLLEQCGQHDETIGDDDMPVPRPKPTPRRRIAAVASFNQAQLDAIRAAKAEAAKKQPQHTKQEHVSEHQAKS